MRYLFFSPVFFLFAVLLTPTAFAADPNGPLLYNRNCAVCHGAEGDGGVGVPLNLPDFLAVASDRYIRLTLREGRPGRVMPGFPALSDPEIEALIRHMRSWSSAPAPDYDSAVISGDPQRGEKLYGNHCAGCHGPQGGGGAGTGVTLSRPRGAQIMAPALNNPAFQRAASDAMLEASLLRGRKGSPMPSVTQLGLDKQDVPDLVAYIRTMKTAAGSEDPPDLEPFIEFDSPYDLQQTLANLKQAVIGKNFRIIREQYLDAGLVPEGKEDRRRMVLYFCNFAFLNDALAIDPRVGLFLPCRVTLVETDAGVKVSSINPKKLSRLFNNSELDRACQEMHDLYVDIMEEATL